MFFTLLCTFTKISYFHHQLQLFRFASISRKMSLLFSMSLNMQSSITFNPPTFLVIIVFLSIWYRWSCAYVICICVCAYQYQIKRKKTATTTKIMSNKLVQMVFRFKNDFIIISIAFADGIFVLNGNHCSDIHQCE